MNGLFALIPVKEPARGKSRLAPLLDAREREALNLALARQTIGVCASLFGAERAIVISAAAAVRPLALEAGAAFVIETPAPAGLNAALAAGAEAALQAGARGVIVVPTDLPLLSGVALERAASALPAAPGCLLVPDRHRSGTNLLGLAPARADFFSFGEGSLERHAARARALGFALRIHDCDELALDLDLPADYDLWTARRPDRSRFSPGAIDPWPTSESTTLNPLARRSDSTPM